MARVTDTELLGLIEGALHRGRSQQTPQPEDWERAAVDAAWVLRALQHARITAIRDQRKGREAGYRRVMASGCAAALTK
jgi:hypothetical protein